MAVVMFINDNFIICLEVHLSDCVLPVNHWMRSGYDGNNWRSAKCFSNKGALACIMAVHKVETAVEKRKENCIFIE